MFLQHLTPATRTLLIQIRCLAMGGELNSALAQIDEVMESQQNRTKISSFDLIALGLLKAELLYLEHRGEEAIKVFDGQVRPHLKTIPEEFRIVIEDNLNQVQTELFAPNAVIDFYRLVDQRRMIRFELSDSSQLIAAREAAAQDKHFDAVRILWNELVQSYQLASWRAHRLAHQKFAEECLLIGLLQDATYHSITALDLNLATKVGDSLLCGRHRDTIDSAIRKILRTANLQQHFEVACKIISRIGDGLPLGLLQPVIEWLIKRARLTPANHSMKRTLDAAWNGLEAITSMLNADQASLVVDAAVQNQYWKNATIYREKMVRVVNGCVPSLPVSALRELAVQTLPLATETKHDMDYVQVINLLCHIAERGEDNVRKVLAEALFPEETRVDPILAQAAPLFGKNIADVSELVQATERLAKNIRLQVQKLDPDQDSTPVSGSLMVMSGSTKDGRKLTVHVLQDYVLGAIAAHRHKIPSDVVCLLIDSMLAMINESENFLSNKASLINDIARFGDSLPEDYLDRILHCLSPLAQGEIVEPSHTKSADVEDPLNPFKIRMGTPAQVQQMSIYALARLDKASQGHYGTSLHKIIEAGLSSSVAEVRQGAFAAAREIHHVPNSMLMALLLGTRDADPMAAAIAYDALATKKDLRLTPNEWRLFSYSLDIACQSPDVMIRRAAAHAVANFAPQAKGNVAKRLRELQQSFANDICASVRRAATSTMI